jgi:hypothetical protein
MLLSNKKFQEILENRFRVDFNEILEKGDDELFEDVTLTEVSKYIDLHLYSKLFSFLEQYEIDNFHRYFTIILRKYWNENYTPDMFDLNDVDFFTLYIAALQYYFT